MSSTNVVSKQFTSKVVSPSSIVKPTTTSKVASKVAPSKPAPTPAVASSKPAPSKPTTTKVAPPAVAASTPAPSKVSKPTSSTASSTKAPSPTTAAPSPSPAVGKKKLQPVQPVSLFDEESDAHASPKVVQVEPSASKFKSSNKRKAQDMLENDESKEESTIKGMIDDLHVLSTQFQQDDDVQFLFSGRERSEGIVQLINIVKTFIQSQSNTTHTQDSFKADAKPNVKRAKEDKVPSTFSSKQYFKYVASDEFDKIKNWLLFHEQVKFHCIRSSDNKAKVLPGMLSDIVVSSDVTVFDDDINSNKIIQDLEPRSLYEFLQSEDSHANNAVKLSARDRVTNFIWKLLCLDVKFKTNVENQAKAFNDLYKEHYNTSEKKLAYFQQFTTKEQRQNHKKMLCKQEAQHVAKNKLSNMINRLISVMKKFGIQVPFHLTDIDAITCFVPPALDANHQPIQEQHEEEGEHEEQNEGEEQEAEQEDEMDEEQLEQQEDEEQEDEQDEQEEEC